MSLDLIGGHIFRDTRLSLNRNQSCETCHHPTEGFAAAASYPTVGGVVEGSIPGERGNRKPPSAAYATLSPRFATSGNGATGGLFWDGRATGARFGSPAADQALLPFTNPVEQALPHEACIVFLVHSSPIYGSAFAALAGAPLSFPAGTDDACRGLTQISTLDAFAAANSAVISAHLAQVAFAIAAFEGTLNRFASPFDAGSLTAQQQQGLKLFSGKGKCQQCHNAKGARAPFTDFAYHNLGVPRNPLNSDFAPGSSLYDRGLGGATGVATHNGRFRTPTLRNVAAGANRTYMHNGVLVSLEQVVDFYSTRDVLRRCAAHENDPARWGSYVANAYGCWPAPEFGSNLDTKNMGKLGLTRSEVDAISAFMRALSDQ
jgi:cytochrome c peroxidase